jgi:hypothetical protein
VALASALVVAQLLSLDTLTVALHCQRQLEHTVPARVVNQAAWFLALLAELAVPVPAEQLRPTQRSSKRM